jgi:hypothetical protein
MTKVQRNKDFVSIYMVVYLFTVKTDIFYIQPLHSKTPSFIGDKSINLSWKEATKPSVPNTAATTG